MAIFMKGTKRELLNVLDIGYGDIVVEGFNPHFVICHDEAKRVLQECIAKGIITADEATEIETNMEQTGCPADMATVMAKVVAYEMPTDFKPSFEFVRCVKCTGAESLAPHGHIGMITDDENNGSMSQRSCEDAFLLSDHMVVSGKVHVLDGVTILKQAIEMGVPVTTEEARRLYDELPAETRERLEAQSGTRLTSIEITGIGHAMVISFSLGSLFDNPGRDS
ncbi:MAG: hypothetical protein Q7S24_01200 [bacterium]|nr:hypothetical protein [bacterium]